MNNQNYYQRSVYHPDTGVEKIVNSVYEDIAETDYLEHEKAWCHQRIATLEKELLYWSKPNMEFRMLPNTREDIMDKLKQLYRYRNEVYCAEEGEYPDEPWDC